MISMSRTLAVAVKELCERKEEVLAYLSIPS